MFQWLRNRFGPRRGSHVQSPLKEHIAAHGYLSPQGPTKQTAVAIADETWRQPLETNCFELVRPVLSELYAELCDQYPIAVTDMIGAALLDLDDMYRRSTNFHYAQVFRRFAYLYKYSPGKASVLCSLMERYDRIRTLFTLPTISVGCIGGGPGTDVLGVLKLWEWRASIAQLKVTIYDADPEWERYWRLIESKNATQRVADVRYVTMNILDPEGATQPHHDLIVMSYVLSEVWDHPDELKTFLRTLIQRATAGTLILIVDGGKTRSDPITSATQSLIRYQLQVCEVIDEFNQESPHQISILDSSIFQEIGIDSDERISAASYPTDIGLSRDEIERYKARPQRDFKSAYWVLEKL